MDENYGEMGINETDSDKSTKLGIENGKRALKKQQKKNKRNQTIKAFWKAIPIKARLILIGTSIGMVAFILLCSAAWYIIEEIGGSTDTNTDEIYNSVVSTESIGMDITSQTMQISEEEIKSYIENYDSTNMPLRNAMLGKIKEIHKWQEDYGYSALFLITVAFEDGKVAAGVDVYITDMNTKAANWKEKGYKTIKEIAKEYVIDDTYAEWANNIETKIHSNSLKSGITVSGEQVMYGDGYDSVYVSKAGKTYINYTQYTKGATTCTYADYIYWIYNGEELSIYHNGCGLTSVAIILSGYRNVGMNPYELTLACAKNEIQFMTPDNFSPVPVLNKYGVQAIRYDKNTEYTEAEKEQYVLNVLRDNRPVMVEVYGPEKGGKSVFTDGMHWIVLLDIDDSTNKVYVSNPSKERSYPSGGWLDIDYVLTSCVDTIRITN